MALLRAPVFVRLRDDIAARRCAGARARGCRTCTRRQAPALPASAAADEAGAVLEQLKNPAKSLELTVAGERIRLTNLDRIYWPADARAHPAPITKRDLIAYLAAVARFMLPHLTDRPLTMIRMPEGISGERFFQKHWDRRCRGSSSR